MSSENKSATEIVQSRENGTCPFCLEPVPLGARKCSECGSDIRGMRKYFTFGSTTLALVTALISVISSSVPAVKWYLEPRDARLHINYFTTTDQLPATLATSASLNTKVASITERKPYILVFLLSNDGTKSGAAVQFRLRVDWTTAKPHTAIFDLNTPTYIPVIAEPGQSVPFALIVNDIFPHFVRTTLFDFQNLNMGLMKYTITLMKAQGSSLDVSALGEYQNEAVESDKALGLQCTAIINTRNSSGTQGELDSQIPCEDVVNRLLYNFFYQPPVAGPLPTQPSTGQLGPLPTQP